MSVTSRPSVARVARASIALGTLAVLAPLAAAGAQGAGARVASADAVRPGAIARAAAPIDWSSGASLPLPVDHHATFVTSGNRYDLLHVIGGREGGKVSGNAYRARIAKDGTVGAWEKGDALPAARSGMSYASDGRIVLLAGGASPEAAATQDVWVAPVWGDGRLGAFKAAPFGLPASRAHTAAVMHGDHVYVIGGTDGERATATVYRAKYSRTQGLSGWTAAAPLPGPRSHHAAFVHEGAIYLVGGIAGAAGTGGDAQPLADVLRATIGKDGELGAWEVVSTLDAALATHAAVVKDGYLYLIGGAGANDRASDRVVRARLAKDGTIGAWEATDATLPAARANVRQVPVLRDYLYSVGGSGGERALDAVVVGRFAR